MSVVPTILITGPSSSHIYDNSQSQDFRDVSQKVESMIEGRPLVERRIHNDKSLYSSVFFREEGFEFEESVSLEELGNPFRTCKMPHPHSSALASRISDTMVKSVGENAILISTGDKSYQIESAKILQLQLFSQDNITYIFSREEDENLEQSIGIRQLMDGQSISIFKMPIPETVIHAVFGPTDSILIEQIGRNYRLAYVKNDNPGKFAYSEKLEFYPWILSWGQQTYCIIQKQGGLAVHEVSLEEGKIFLEPCTMIGFPQDRRIEAVTLTSKKLFILYTEPMRPLPKIFGYEWCSEKIDATILCKFVLLRDEPFKAEMIYSKDRLHVVYAAIKTTLVANSLIPDEKPKMIELKAIAEITVDYRVNREDSLIR